MADAGRRFWLKAIGLMLAFGIVGIVLFSLMGMAWYAGGALAALLLSFVLLLAAGRLYDRTHAKP